MKPMRLMDRPEDYSRLNVQPQKVAPWEDGRRDTSRPGAFEWWYFDAILDDGTKVVSVFMPKHRENLAHDGDLPHVHLQLTLPDGTQHVEAFQYRADEASFRKEACDVKIGAHHFAGDLQTYSVKVNAERGWGADLKLESLGEPWRPGTGYFGFGEHDEQYFTWLCVVPKGRVTGTITLDGQVRTVTGFGYHDHQWGNIFHALAWNHWVWARQNAGDYNILVFDLVAGREYGFKRHALTFVQDASGRVLFQNTGAGGFEVPDEYRQDKTDKMVPRVMKYTFENGGKRLEYVLRAQRELDITDAYSDAPPPARARFDAMQLRPTYTRWAGEGHLVLTDGNNVTDRTSSLIYEMVYSGKTYKEHVG